MLQIPRMAKPLQYFTTRGKTRCNLRRHKTLLFGIVVSAQACTCLSSYGYRVLMTAHSPVGMLDT